MADGVASLPPAPAAPVPETPSTGLTGAQVAERLSRGLTNAGGEHTSRSVAHILRANILTRFNLILGVLLAVILVAGQPQDALFGVVLVTNALIGIAQELRAKLTLDRLAVLSAPQVRVIRDGTPHDIAVADLVAGDLVDLRAGDQLVADGVVRASTSLEADESLLTGESEPVPKVAGDEVLSGGVVVAGSGRAQALRVGMTMELVPGTLVSSTGIEERVWNWRPVGSHEDSYADAQAYNAYASSTEEARA